MRRKFLIVLAMTLILSAVSAVSATAKAPLTGDMDLEFNLAWPGPQDVLPDWVGTITIGEEEYGE